MTRLDLRESGRSPNMTRLGLRRSGESPNMTRLDLRQSGESRNTTRFEVLFLAGRSITADFGTLADWRHRVLIALSSCFCGHHV